MSCQSVKTNPDLNGEYFQIWIDFYPLTQQKIWHLNSFLLYTKKINKSEIKRFILVIRIIQSENFLETKNPKVSNVKSNGPQHRKWHMIIMIKTRIQWCAQCSSAYLWPKICIKYSKHGCSSFSSTSDCKCLAYFDPKSTF